MQCSWRQAWQQGDFVFVCTLSSSLQQLKQEILRMWAKKNTLLMTLILWSIGSVEVDPVLVLYFFCIILHACTKEGFTREKHGRTRTLSWANHCLHFASQININEDYVLLQNTHRKTRECISFKPFLLFVTPSETHTQTHTFLLLLPSCSKSQQSPTSSFVFLTLSLQDWHTNLWHTHTHTQTKTTWAMNKLLYTSESQTDIASVLTETSHLRATKGTYCAGIFKEHFGVSTSCFVGGG